MGKYSVKNIDIPPNFVVFDLVINLVFIQSDTMTNYQTGSNDNVSNDTNPKSILSSDSVLCQGTILYFTVLYYTVPRYYTVLYCTALC